MSLNKDNRLSLQKKSIKDLVALRKDLRKELYSLKVRNKMRWLQQTHLIPQARKKIAQVNTLLSYKIKEEYGSTMR